MDSILVKFPLTIKAKLTEKLKNKMLDEMRKTMQQAQLEIQQINIQENRAIQENTIDGEEPNPAIMQQIQAYYGVM